MDEKILTERLNTLFKDEQFTDAFFDNIDNKEAIADLLKKNDVDLMEEEIQAIIEYAKTTMSKEELSEEDMDNVSGGFGIIGGLIIGIGGGIFFGYQTYKARKAINQMRGTCG